MKGFKVLVVDDSVVSRKVLAEKFEKDGAEVVQVKSGQEALSRLEQHSFDCAYIDYEMPEMNGLELIEKIHALNLNPRPALTLLTSNTSEDIYQRAIEAGADAYIPKGQSVYFPTVHVSDLVKKLEAERAINEEVDRQKMNSDNGAMKGLKVLLVDDSLLSRKMMARALESDGAFVVQASSGEDALKLLIGNVFQCVYIDYEMPRMSGLELIQAIHELNLSPRPALTLLTSHDSNHVYKPAMEAGADAFMSKGDRVHFPSIHVADLIKKLEAEAKLKEEVENRRRIELDLMKAKEKAEASTRAKGEFLANMSHEIRTPLNGVLGMAQILETSQLDSSQQEHLSVLMNSGNALLSVLNDILDFSKIEAGKLSVEEVSFDLHLCIEETCDLLIPKVQEKDLELIYRIKPGVPKYILGDPGRLRQILTNYFSNAIKFTFEGHVLLEVECLRLEDDTVDLRFSVIDTGVGIPEDKQSLIFEKFAQADTSTTRKFGGTGLGLSICQQLAHLMGGDVGLESREGVGSTFWLDMPAMINKKENVVVSKQAQEPLQSCRILYVDSHTLNQKVFEEHFHGTNAEVTLCASAMEAFKVLGNSMLAEEPYDILVTEHRMNKHSGLTLMESIHKRFPDMVLRSVMLTGTPEKGEAQQMRNAGFHAYVPKPARRDILRKIVSMLLGTESSNLSETFLTRHSIREMEEGQQQKGKEEEQIQLKVLLAEDNLINQKVAIKMLGKIGVDVDVATDGKIAIEKFTSGDYELIIMDCMMPNMDGYAATRQIRSSNHERAKDIPIVAMTAHAMEGSREKCLDAGMTDFISKPFKFDTLKEILRKYAQPFS